MKKPDWLPLDIETNLITIRTLDLQINELTKQLQVLKSQRTQLDSEVYKAFSRDKTISLMQLNEVKLAMDRGEYELSSAVKDIEKPKPIVLAGIHPLDR